MPAFAPLAPAAAQREFLLTDGLTYLNTGTIGPTRRSTMDATQRAWATLEENPIAHYGQLAAMRDDTRTVGLGAAIRYLDVAGMAKVEAHNLRLRSRLADRLEAIDGLTLVSPPAGDRASPLLTAWLAARFDRRAVTQALFERHQVAIRATHPEFGFNGIRFSMHEFNTDADVDRAADAVRRELVS